MFKSFLNDLKILPFRGLLLTLFLLLSTFMTLELTNSPAFKFSRADEIILPQGYSALEYLQALGQSDVNNDGTINLFDYAILLDKDYGKQEAFITSDINFDQKANAIDASFMLNHLYTDVDGEREKIFASAEYVKEVNREIARRNEDVLPVANLEDNTLTISSEEGGSEPQFGRNVIPQVLGTISAYTGSSSYGMDFQVPSGPGGMAPSLGLSYSSGSIDDARNQGSNGGKPFYTEAATYMPYQFGYGFSLSGIGSIVRDTKEEKELYKLKGNLYHRFILNLPGGISAELKYNPSTGRWVSIPQSFLKIEHEKPVKRQIGNLTYLDPGDWIVTTKDGVLYYFGEEDISTKLEPNGLIKGSEQITYFSDNEQKDVVIGSKSGNFYNEFDTANLCEGESEREPCSRREKDGKVLIVTKWLLRKVQSPDGKAVNYTYDTNQKKLDKPWKDTNIEYVTASSYPQQVTWNDDKHRVRFVQEERPDKGNREFMRNRIKEVLVETKIQQDGQYHTVRKYALGYFDLNKKTKEGLGEKAASEGTPPGEGIENDFRASFLTSVQEFGTDGTTALPPTTFKYVQYRFAPQSYHGGEIYLWKIDNGYGGETRFAYQPIEVGAFDPNGKPAGGKNRRVRVIQKEVADLVANKSFKETYNYGDARIFSENFRKAPTGEGGSAQEFLGHSSVEIKQYDFGGSLLGHTETFFNQANWGERCFEPHPAKGRPFRQVVYRGDSKDIAQETDTVFKYRLDGNDGQNPSDGCTQGRRNQPIFLYIYDTTNIQREALKDFVPAGFKNKIQGAANIGKTELRTLQRVLAHDEYGNQTLGADYGEVDANGIDVDKTDNRFSYTYYVTSGAAWIKGLPNLVYSSNIQNCGAEDKVCQWGRSKMYYDNFEKNYWQLTAEELQPRYGFLTQKETWIDDTHLTVEGYVYDDLSGNIKDADVRKGAVVQTYGAKPNLKTVENPQEDLIITSTKKYDQYYRTFLLEEKNVLGHKGLYEGYDPLLQIPTVVKRQVQANPEIYAASKMEFDALGRMTAEFAPDPTNPGLSMNEPFKVTHFFERGNEGLVVRSAALSSQTSDGKKNYQVSDTFYDGIGQVLQAQILQTNVEGKDVRKVSINEYHADGKSTKAFEIQTADPVIIDTVNGTNYKTVLGGAQPQFLTNVTQVVTAETQFDVLRRPIATTQIETATGQKYTTTMDYGIFMTKSADPKGVEKVAISDVRGRGRYSFTQDASKQKSLMTVSEYGKPMVDKATKITIVDNAGQKIDSLFDYNKSGRLIFSFDPSLNQYKFEYDVYGNKLLEVSQPREDVGFSYDPLGRLVKKEYFSLSQGELYNKMARDAVHWIYDEGPFSLGKLHKVEHLTGNKDFAYDGGQRLVSTKIKTFDNEKEFKTSFNQLSQELTSTYPDKTQIQKEYDREGRLAKMRVNDDEVFSSSAYDKFGREKNSNIQYNGNQYTSSNTFDSMGRIMNLVVNKKAAVPGTGIVDQEILKQELKYNNAAEIEQLNDVVQGQATVFIYGYDGFSQLTSVSSSLYNTSYEYDLFGRILKKNEKDQVTMKYSSNFPFFAPEQVTITGEEPFEIKPEQTVVPSANPTRAPTPTEGLQPVEIKQALGVNTRSLDIAYTNEGGMKSDETNCYIYNREGELIKLGIKKSRTSTCTDENYKKVFMFYYDEAGSLNLQEEYLPTDIRKPVKQLYLFGVYEEEVTN